MATETLKRGASVVVPWGTGEVHGEVLEVWGDPPQHVRVRLHLGRSEGADRPDESDDVIVLLSADLVHAHPAA